MIEDERGHIDYDESGEGPTVVLVPGSCSTGAAWRPVVTQWAYGFRCVTTSLLGYGGTAERRTALDVDIAHEAEVIEAVIRRAASPVHLVGHSFGGLTALAVALRKRVPLLSLTIVEAPALEILRSMGECRHYQVFREMTDAYFAAWPQRVRDYAAETTPVNLLDWESAYGFQLTPDLLATVDISTLVFWGGDSHPTVQRANALLGRCIPNAVVATVAGAAHFMISTHAREAARLISQHMTRARA
ncbi:pimeloyl-ACP methyl ester carboxylesterase [Nitrobacteraceae bacterium AZCC 2161]